MKFPKTKSINRLVSRLNFRQKTISLTMIVILLVASIIISFSPSFNSPQVAHAGWYGDSSWLYRQKITIDHTKVTNSDQTDFPVMIKITNEYNQIFSSAKDDGTDILFTSSDGATKLSHEVEVFSKSNKELWVWVKIPILSASLDTEVYMYYGNSGATDQQNKTAVWSNGYAAVWHLNESSGSSLDSTASNISGTPSAAVTQSNIGKVGKDYLLNGSAAVNYGNSSSLPNGTSARTMCAWAKTNSVAAGYAWNFAYGTNSNGQAMFIGRSGTSVVGGAYANDISAGNYWSVGDWKYTCLTYDGVNATLYGNGSQIVAPTAKSWSLVRNYTVLGSQVPSGENWNGDVDEVKISTVARSADWIATEFNNQNDPGSFISINYELNQTNFNTRPEDQWISSSWKKKQKIQVTNNTSGALFDYQVKIDSSTISLTNVFANSKEDGADIRITDASGGNVLSHYISSYSASSSTAKIWVKIPYIPPSTSAYIYLYYDNDAANSTSSIVATGGATETKISSGLTANATSSYAGYPASNAIDGNLTTFWHGANDGQLHSWQVSGVTKPISTIKIFHFAGQWASTFKVQGSNDNFSSDVREISNVTAPTQDMVFSDVNAEASGLRYLTLTTSNWFNPTIYEFETYTKFKTASVEPSLALSGDQLVYDETAPTNPTALSEAKNASGGSINLVSDNFYNYPTPYFSWPAVGQPNGATDDMTGVGGYYAYFGTSCGASGADPFLTRGVLADNGSGKHFTANNYVNVPTISNGTYCLRIKTTDSVGNIAGAVELFSYKFEDIPPTRPTYISSSPAGYSSTNSYAFSWPAATEQASTPQSGLAGYQYRRGEGSSDDWSSTTSNTTVSGIASYQTGENIFLVRSVDNAGNVSGSVQTTYYYSSNPPVKPTSLTATPALSESNSFAFSWTAPVHSVPIISYGYSINAYPTSDNLTWTPTNGTSLTADSYATIQGENALYLVAKDETGAYSLESESVAIVVFNCTTSAPPAPADLTISDSSNRITNMWALTLKWSAGPNQNSSTFDHYRIERSLDNNVFSTIATTQSQAYIDLGNLNNTTDYYYRVKSVDNAGSVSASSTIVNKTPTGRYGTPPTVVSNPTVSAKASGAVISWTVNRQSTSSVRFGKSTDNLDRVQINSTENTSHSVTLDGLDAGTKYYYQVQALDNYRDYSSESAFSPTYEFTTLSAPGIKDLNVQNVTINSAEVIFETSTASSMVLNYGTSISYGNVLENTSQTTMHTARLQKLEPGTTYHLRINGVDVDGNSLISDDYVVTTLPMPEITDLTIQPDYAGPNPGIKINWKTNVPTSSSVEYIPKQGSVLEEESKSALVTEHEILLTGLTDSTSYRFYVYGTDQFGNSARSSENYLDTPLDSRPPKISDLYIESQTVGVDSESKAQIVVSWTTDELSTSQVEYGQGVGGDTYGSKTQNDSSLSMNHTVIISNLDPSKTYHLRAISADKAGNIANSEDNAVITKKQQVSPFNIIFSALQKAFSWLNIFN